MAALPHVPSPPRISGSGLTKALSLVFCIYLTEVVIGGPGQWAVAGIPIRHILFSSVLLLYAIDIGKRGLILEDLVTAVWLSLLFGIWVLAVPRLSFVPLNHSVGDGRPFIAAVVFPILVRLSQSDALPERRFENLLANATFAVVVLHVCFAAILYFFGHRMGQDTAEIFFCGHAGCPGIYVGGIPEGGLRVHWVGSIFILLYATRALSSGRTLQGVLLGLATYFSLSRALWVAFAVLVVLTLLFLRSPALIRQILVVVLTFLIADQAVTSFSFSPDTTFSPDDTNSLATSRATSGGFQIRYEQAMAHLEVLAENPLLGTGFGSITSVIRSSEIPWSSESTYTALAYKLGALGSALLATPAFLLWRRIRRRRVALTVEQKRYIVTLVSVLIMGAFNPYLINSVGITFLAALYALIYQEPNCSPSPPRDRATVCKHGSA